MNRNTRKLKPPYIWNKQTNLEVQGEAEKHRRTQENSCQLTNDASIMSRKTIWEQLNSNSSLFKVDMSSKRTLFIVFMVPHQYI